MTSRLFCDLQPLKQWFGMINQPLILRTENHMNHKAVVNGQVRNKCRWARLPGHKNPMY